MNVKSPLPTVAQKPATPSSQLPQKPATKGPWLLGETGPGGETIMVPESRPDVLVFIKSETGYVKAMEIDRGGDSLFGTGPVASEFTEILTEAISRKISVTCKSAPGGSGIHSIGENVIYIRDQLDAKHKRDEFAMNLLGIAMGAAILCIIVYLVIGRMQNRGR